MAKLTLDEIGRLAGVSRATVSRVVNHYPHIRPEVRERVERIIQETGFQPNAVARSLASNRSNIIGLVIPHVVQHVFTDPYFAYLIQGISQICNANGQVLSLYLFQTLEEERTGIQNVLVSGLIDGLIITADQKNQSVFPLLFEHDVPFVLVGRAEDPGRVSYVDTDNVAGAHMAVTHLIQLGRRRIATIATGANTAGEDRYKGYCAALHDYGIALDHALVVYADFSLESGYHAMKQLIPAQPDAVFVTSDTMALGALRALRETRLRVPDDIALVGYDDLPPALHAEPPLTTIQQPIEQTGIAAARLLLDRIKSPSDLPRHIVMPNKLVIRASCGALMPE